MLSTGNDIVSLGEIDPERTILPVFYKKFLNDTEIAQYSCLKTPAAAFEIYVWMLWSVKEAAYKYLKRSDPRLVFSPVKFVVGEPLPADSRDFKQTAPESLKAEWTGEVAFGHFKLSYLTSVTAGYVHTIVSSMHNNIFSVHQRVAMIEDSTPQNQSVAVRQLCVNLLSEIKPDGNFEIVKSEQGVPLAIDVTKGHTYPVSFSHHGNYVACSVGV